LRIGHYLKCASTNPLLLFNYLGIYSRAMFRRTRSQRQTGQSRFNCFGYDLVLNTAEPMQLGMARCCYSPMIEGVLRKVICTNSVFYDVGAHAGYFSALACSLVGPQGRVLAFEPNPDRQASLRSLAESAPQFQFVERGLSDHEGTVLFERNDFNSGMSRIVSDDVSASSDLLTISVSKLDNVIEHLHLPLPAVVKIDVEGHELQVLDGAKRMIEKAHPVIVCEVERTQHSSFLDLAAFIERAQYAVYPTEFMLRRRVGIEWLTTATQSGVTDVVLIPQ